MKYETIKPLQFERATNPGMTPPELEALGLSIVQDIEGVQVYKLSGSGPKIGDFNPIITPLWVSVYGERMWISRNWVPGVTTFHPYDLGVIREFVLKAHEQYKEFQFPDLPPTEDEIFQEALNYNCSDNVPEREEELTPFEQYGLAFRKL